MRIPPKAFWRGMGVAAAFVAGAVPNPAQADTFPSRPLCMKSLPMGRMGQTAEIADMVAFLASPRAQQLPSPAQNFGAAL